MIKSIVVCNWCGGYITKKEDKIIIEGKIHYCDALCKKFNQEQCLNLTNHRNSEKDQVQGHCLDCGISYAEAGL